MEILLEVAIAIVHSSETGIIKSKTLPKESNSCAPKGTRTPVLALRGPRPRPLDNGGG